MKFTVGMSKKVQTYPYQNIEVTLTAEFNDEEVPYDYGYRTVSEKVNEWINNELKRMGLLPNKNNNKYEPILVKPKTI